MNLFRPNIANIPYVKKKWLYLVHHTYVKKNGKRVILYLFETSVSMRAKKKCFYLYLIGQKITIFCDSKALVLNSKLLP